MGRPEAGLRLLPPDTNLVEWLLSLPPERRAGAIDLMGPAERESLDRDWASWAHEGQGSPPGDWRTWVIKAGRGFGKTLAGANWITSLVAGDSLSGCPHSGAGGQSNRLSPPLSIALVGATLDEARRVMVEGRSGLLAIADAWVRDWNPSLRRLTFTTGAEAVLFSGASPEQLRGPEHHFAWCDELAKWEKPQATWDMLQLGLRLGTSPRVLVTTTPRPGPVLRAIMAAPECVVTGGPSGANPHVSPAWQQTMAARYAGTRLGRQELDGELLTDAPGALWTVELLERCRLNPPRNDCGVGLPPAIQVQSGGLDDSAMGDRAERGGGVASGSEHGGSLKICAQRRGDAGKFGLSTREAAQSSESRKMPAPPGSGKGHGLSAPPRLCANPVFTRIVIAVDPPSGDGTCGIIACAKDASGIAHVLADHSVTARTPEGWSRAVADAALLWGTVTSDCPHSCPVQVVAEQNQGGKMVAAVLRTADPNLRVKLVTATVGKAERAAPVAMLFEAGKVVLHGRFPELEAELLGMIAGGEYQGPGVSPDRADAMVWGLTELMLAPEQIPPRVRQL